MQRKGSVWEPPILPAEIAVKIQECELMANELSYQSKFGFDLNFLHYPKV